MCQSFKSWLRHSNVKCHAEDKNTHLFGEILFRSKSQGSGKTTNGQFLRVYLVNRISHKRRNIIYLAELSLRGLQRFESAAKQKQ